MKKYGPDIDKLRRFSLVVALILLTYSISGISLKPDSVILVMGFPMNVARPELLPIGFVITSMCLIVRFYYYGFMLNKSPSRFRRDAIKKLYLGKRLGKGKINRLLGHFSFGQIKNVDSSIYDEDQNKVESFVERFPNIFPKFAGAIASAKLYVSESHNEDGEPTGIMYGAKVSIPIRCRLAATFENIDYSVPIWLNLISLAIYWFPTLKSRLWLSH